MSQTSRERMRRALTFDHPDRIPRDIWALPLAKAKMAKLKPPLLERYPVDLMYAPLIYSPSPRVKGNVYDVGTYVDEWGVVWENIQAGHQGEVRAPILGDLGAWKSYRPPYELMGFNPSAARDTVNRACAAADKFVLGACCPRPWERYQFLRGTENAMIDMADPDKNVTGLLHQIHDFFCAKLDFWVKTDVDAILLMDDWGSQQQLLIHPESWRRLFKPLYRDYCQAAQAHGKFIFMHSDGNITAIYPDLIELGVNALNSQLFCMDMAALAALAKGKLTFWGEIDRQHVMNAAEPQAGRDAVRKVATHLYSPAGGIIAQFELADDSNLEVATAVLDEWEKVAQ